MSFWIKTTISKNRARREWRGTTRIQRSIKERLIITKRLRRRRAERLRARKVNQI